MKICIVSDSHDRAELLARAVAAAKQDGAQVVIHCGDVIGPHTVRGLQKYELPVHIVHGNNIGDTVVLAKMSAAPGTFIHYHGMDARLTLGTRRVFVIHYPDYGAAMAATGQWDLVCCGHSHRAEITRVPNVHGGETVMVNPGTVAGIGAPATYITGDLETLEFSIKTLDL